MSFIKEFDHLKIQLEDIKSATNNFGDSNLIGRGGFGKVYKGELLLSQGLTMVALKRLDTAFGQGAPEFWKEIMMLSRYKHENLVSLLGFCDEKGENVLVYEYLPNKSLDYYLISDELSLNQRLHICIGAARGLQYLHDPEGTQQRVLHRDIKSANILLDENWKAKISDFGLSKFGPANQQFTFLVSNGVGTIGYCDPLYMETGYLTKESDVYSFGVVLFEVLCGRFCIQNYNDIRRFLPKLAQKHYEERKLDTIVKTSLKEQISSECLERFSTIAYQCLNRDRTQRPSMTKIVEELEMALHIQVQYEFEKEKERNSLAVLESYSDEYWEEIIRMLNIPHTHKNELYSLLQKGLLFDEDNKFFWINNYGKKCVSISAKPLLGLNGALDPISPLVFVHNSRFSWVAEYPYGEFHDVKCQIKTSMLSPDTMYAASLVFKYSALTTEYFETLKLMTIKWRTEELSVCSIHAAEVTTDNWFKIQMWRFINHGPNADFDIVVEKLSCLIKNMAGYHLYIQGIEFQPVEMGMHEEIKGFTSLTISDEEDIDDDAYWEKKLPIGYQYYVRQSIMPLHYTSQKELYFLLCAGILDHSGQVWFSLCKSTGKICAMLSATNILLEDSDYEHLDTLSLPESRFREVKKLGNHSSFVFTCRLQQHMFSTKSIYACYLVFKFADNHKRLIDDSWLLKAKCYLDNNFEGRLFIYMTLTPPTNIPTIKPKNDCRSCDSSTRSRNECLRTPNRRMGPEMLSWIEERKDGWKEVMLCKSLHQLDIHESLKVILKRKGGNFSNIIVEGIEFRPMQG